MEAKHTYVYSQSTANRLYNKLIALVASREEKWVTGGGEMVEGLSS